MSADQTFRERRIAELERHAGVLRNRIQELRIDYPEAADARRDQLAQAEEEIAELRSAGEWEDLHRELFNAVYACTDPADKVCGLHPGPERDELEAVIGRHKTVHRREGERK